MELSPPSKNQTAAGYCISLIFKFIIYALMPKDLQNTNNPESSDQPCTYSYTSKLKASPPTKTAIISQSCASAVSLYNTFNKPYSMDRGVPRLYIRNDIRKQTCFAKPLAQRKFIHITCVE